MKLINAEPIWEKPIMIQLSLRELQLLFDSLGSTAWKSLENNWETYGTLLEMPYNMDDNDLLYEELEDLLTRLGGVTCG